MPQFQMFLPLASASTPATGTAVERPGASGVVTPTTGTETAVSTNGSTTATSPSGSQSAPASQPKPPESNPMNMFLIVILMVGVVYFVLFRGQRKDEKKRKSMIAELKKGDRVMTIGGMLAKVVSVDGEEVVLKVDEAANVKATYRKSAIQEVIVDKEEKK